MLKFGKTIFHLEPNLKDGPGGLRDFHVTRWIALIAALEADRAWPESLHLQQNSDDDDVLEAMEFLSSARCYLHYRSNRDENIVTWEAQEDLARRGIGSGDGSAVVGRVDAAVFPQRQGDVPQRHAVAGANHRQPFVPGALLPSLAIARFER